MRLDKFLTETGNGTRSEVKKLISSGAVTVNGSTVKDPGAKVSEKSDEIAVRGNRVAYAEYEYFMLNKPQGVISASRDEHKHAGLCVTDLIKDKIRRDLFPVGRLDKDTEGLLLITNDGDLAHRLLSPKKHVDKTYFAEVDGRISPEAAERIMAGPDIGDEKPALPCSINLLTKSSCLITIREGRYHEIKRLFQTEGLNVTALKRISMGPLSLDPELSPGDYRRLTEEELRMLKESDRTDRQGGAEKPGRAEEPD